MKTLLELLKKYRELISYLFWGVLTTIVSWGSYSLFTIALSQQKEELHMFGTTLSFAVLMANILSWVCAFLFAYITNKLWVFNSRSWKPSVVLPEFTKFFSARVFTGILEIVAVPLLVAIGLDQTIMGIKGMVAKVIVSLGVVILNYVFSKLLIFRHSQETL